MRLLKSILLIPVIFLVACSDTLEYDDDDVAAVVMGNEITIGDLRFLVPDEDVLNAIDGMVKAELAKYEIENMDLDMEEEVLSEGENVQEYPPEDVNTSWAKSTREFAEKQAEKFDMDPEEYFNQYTKITTEQSAYVVAFIEEKIGEPEGGDEETKAYSEKADELLDQLMEEHEDDFEVFIRPSDSAED